MTPLQEALAIIDWMSAADDFSPSGKARLGWNRQQGKLNRLRHIANAEAAPLGPKDVVEVDGKLREHNGRSLGDVVCGACGRPERRWEFCGRIKEACPQRMAALSKPMPIPTLRPACTYSCLSRGCNCVPGHQSLKVHRVQGDYDNLIEEYPAAVVYGDDILLNGKRIGMVTETRMVQSRDELIAMAAASQLKFPNKPCIDDDKVRVFDCEPGHDETPLKFTPWPCVDDKVRVFDDSRATINSDERNIATAVTLGDMTITEYPFAICYGMPIILNGTRIGYANQTRMVTSVADLLSMVGYGIVGGLPRKKDITVAPATDVIVECTRVKENAINDHVCGVSGPCNGLPRRPIRGPGDAGYRSGGTVNACTRPDCNSVSFKMPYGQPDKISCTRRGCANCSDYGDDVGC